jgi:pimeloyl-ACP methyl ester carboxylesterase
VDTLVLRVMYEIFVRGHRKNEQQAGGVRSLEGEWRRLAREAADNPQAFFPPPRPPKGLIARRRRRIRGGRIDDLEFPSSYAPGRDAARRMLQRYPENATAHARHLRHDGTGHPALIWLHGWGMGNYRVESSVLRPASYFRRGLDVYLYVQPYHTARMPAGVRFAGTMHPSTQITRTNEAFLQTAWEVRALAARHRQSGGPCGVMGWSLGGYVAALLASVAPELAFAIPMMPLVDVPALLWSWGEGTSDRARAEAAGITFDEFCESMAVHAPLARSLQLPRERVLLVGAEGDRIIPPVHTTVLHDHWGRPRLHWFPGSHIVHFGRDGYRAAVLGFLRDIGVV